MEHGRNGYLEHLEVSGGLLNVDGLRVFWLTGTVCEYKDRLIED